MKRVAIIGAGACGLPAIKCCLDEGLLPVCFERTTNIGGLWNIQNFVQDRQATVMPSTIANTSKEMACYSDFLFPEAFPIYPTQYQVMEYIRMYAEHFELVQHVRFSTEVTKVERAADFDDTGRWNVEVYNSVTHQRETQTFDFLMICTGLFAKKYQPHFEGEEMFEGELLHSREYRDFHKFERKRVVVVGMKNSGADIAVELSSVGSQVFLSSKAGGWLLSKTVDRGMPLDFTLNRLASFKVMKHLPYTLVSSMVEKAANRKFDHEFYGIKPKHRFLAPGGGATINDTLASRIISGTVVIRPDIKNITRMGVVFEDGTSEDNIDAIILATGYDLEFPFMNDKCFEVRKNTIDLYKAIFPPEIYPTSAAVIGCVSSSGAIPPIAELQCRYAIRVFKREISLPSSHAMRADVEENKDKIRKLRKRMNFDRPDAHFMSTNFVGYMNEVAELSDCQPKFFELLLTDPRLAFKVYFGPAAPYIYRLRGHGAWAGARDAILDVDNRVKYPFRNSRNHANNYKHQTGFKYILYVFAVILLIVIWLCV